MKKIILSFVILTLLVTVSGCKPSQYISEDQESYDQAIEILRCLDEEDVEGLKSLFCERVASTHDLDDEIGAAMDFYQGKSESFSNILEGGGYSTVDGKYVDFHLGYLISDIITDKDIQYEIVAHSYLIYDDDPECTGMTSITIYDINNDDNIEIGEFVW